MDKLRQYISGKGALPEKYQILPVYGAGLDNVGDEEGGTIEKMMDKIADDELLVRHDADSICFSDIKVIKQGQDHPRIYQNMSEDPVVLGHELTMTIIQVGEKLQDKYQIGQRFTIQADIYDKGVSYAYGYYFQGGMSQYGVIKPIVLCSDGGNNNLLPLKDSTGYAEGALAEPWACVVAAYSLQYRTTLKAGGKAWFIGVGDERNFELTTGFDTDSHPVTVYVTGLSESMTSLITKKAEECSTEVVSVETIDDLPVEFVDDIIMLGVDLEKVQSTSTKLEAFGIYCVMADEKLDKKISLDLGRVHYHRWLYIGSTSTDISATYQNSLPRNTLLAGGTVLYAGAGGPIGRMHVQRAIEFQNPPKKIVCTDVSEMRLQDM
ncbi:MAG: alcohol dehydrogenase catalytic domain-containing protein, partial [Anaerolineaceae bacterium]|nr:alcohol dehydrogenase catalytic domain-containing protein [Anaerolineaceae bacterium]